MSPTSDTTGRGERDMRVLWLYGGSGVGKSSIAWELYRNALSGAEVALVELDQIRMCDPQPADDPGNVRLAVEDLAGIWSNLRAHGVRGLLVTGAPESRRAVDAVTARIPEASVTICRLQASPEEHARRYRLRGFALGSLDTAVSDAATVDVREPDDLRVDITAFTVAEAAREVLAATAWVPRRPSAAPAPAHHEAEGSEKPPSSPGSLPLIWLSGPRGAGKTAAGYRVAARIWRSGTRAAYVDLDQLSYCGHGHQAEHSRCRAGNLAAVWRGFRSAGAECVVVSGSGDDLDVLRTYGGAVPDADWTLCRLDALPEVLRGRLLGRARARTSVGLPNPLRDLSDDEIARVAEHAVAHSEAMVRGAGDLCIDTSDRTLDEVVQHASSMRGRP